MPDVQKVTEVIGLVTQLLQLGAIGVSMAHQIAADNGADAEHHARLDAAYAERIAREEAIARGESVP